MRVAYLGPRGSFSDQAVQLAFAEMAQRQAVEFAGLATIEDVIEAFEAGAFDFALLPIENSIEGPVNVTIDKLFHESSAQVVGEIVLPIVQNLLVSKAFLKNPQPVAFDKIFSHPQALAQSRNYLRAHFPTAELVPLASTALAAQIIKEHAQDPFAAVANLAAADYYDLAVLDSQIQDVAENNTRFWLLGKSEVALPLPKLGRKVSLALTLPENLPGALHKAISTFAWRGIDMTKIESRPLKTKLGQYFFIIDLVEDEKIRFALEELQSLGVIVRLLGSYEIYEGKMSKK